MVFGYDTRFASEQFARAGIEVLAAHDILCHVPSQPTPTPVTSLFTQEIRAGLGVVITASHNPWTFNGVKIKSAAGSPVASSVITEIESTLDQDGDDASIPRRPYDDAVSAGLVHVFDPYPRAAQRLGQIVDLDRIRAANLRVLVDPMHGAGAGWFSRLLAGGRLRVRELHSQPDPSSGA